MYIVKKLFSNEYFYLLILSIITIIVILTKIPKCRNIRTFVAYTFALMACILLNLYILQSFGYYTAISEYAVFAGDGIRFWHNFLAVAALMMFAWPNR